MNKEERIERFCAKRYQELLKSDAPDWMKRGAYLYLLHHLPIDVDNPEATKQLLEAVGIKASLDATENFCADVEVGIMHIDETLRSRLMATAWIKQDEVWRNLTPKWCKAEGCMSAIIPGHDHDGQCCDCNSEPFDQADHECLKARNHPLWMAAPATGWVCCGKPVETVGLDVRCTVCKRVSR